MRSILASAVLTLLVGTVPAPVFAQDANGGAMSLDSLLNIKISAAARYEQTTREAAASTSVVTREDIERFGWNSLGELLGSVSGFYTTSDRNFIFLGARGFARPSDHNNRILLLVDGRRVQGIANAQADLEEGAGIPLEHIERVEVVRGPGSALYGSSAMLAVINVVTRRAESGKGVLLNMDQGQDGLARATASAAGEARGIEYSAFASWLDDPGEDVYFPEFDVPGFADGWARGVDFWRGYTMGAEVRLGDFRLFASTDGSDRGDPTAPYLSAFNRRSKFETSRWAANLQYDRTLGSRAHLSLSAHALTADHLVALPQEGDDDASVDAEQFGDRLGAEAQLTLDVSPTQRVITGLEVITLDPHLAVGLTGREELLLGDRTNLFSAFGQFEWQVTPALSLVGGGRLDNYSTVEAAVSPRGAAVYHLSDATTFKFLYGTAFRAPTPLEQFIEQPGLLVVNPDLGPEEIRTVELVWEQRVGARIHATFNVFDYQLEGLISQGLDPESRALTYQNLPGVHGKGASLEFNARLDGGVTLFANGTVQAAHQEPSDRESVNSPGHLLRAGVSTPIPGGFRVSSTVGSEGSRQTYRGESVDGPVLLGLQLRSPLIHGLRATLRTENLLNAEYGHPAGLEHRQISIPQLGRTLRLSLTAVF